MESIRTLELKNLYFDWNKDSRERKGRVTDSAHGPLLNDLQFSIKASERVGILGGTGSGKSTLAQILCARVEAKIGEYHLNERKLSFQEYKSFVRLQCQLLPQIPTLGFNPMLGIQQSMDDALPLYQKKHGLEKQDAYENFTQDLKELCSVFDIDDSLLQRLPSQLSGGQLQRFALVRALVIRPDLLILDEPVSFLDLPLQKRILASLLEFQSSYKTTMVIITHLREVHDYFSQRRYSLVEGKLSSI